VNAPFADSDMRTRKLRLLASAMAAATLFGWAGGTSAQTTNDSIPSLPSSGQDTGTAPAQQQASAAPSTNTTASNLPPLALGHDGIGEVQRQLIALGFNPGPVDGVAGPGTLAAAQQFNESRGYSGPVPIDPWLLTRLQKDDGARLTPEQVAVRSRPHYSPAPPDPLTHAMQQLGSGLRHLFNGGY
jgi:peptidoglycan hydrolase-like protein with peptidoglycan-binding domain